MSKKSLKPIALTLGSFVVASLASSAAAATTADLFGVKSLNEDSAITGPFASGEHEGDDGMDGEADGDDGMDGEAGGDDGMDGEAGGDDEMDGEADGDDGMEVATTEWTATAIRVTLKTEWTATMPETVTKAAAVKVPAVPMTTPPKATAKASNRITTLWSRFEPKT
ncbi:MAG: hypothetical protein J4F97_04040 [Pseudomonadales bacterium]|nr:hypothetical protein [Pseudomonadales bacterium]